MSGQPSVLRGRTVRIALVAAWIAAIAVAVPFAPDVETVREWVRDAGPAGPLTYVAAYVAAVLLLVPRPLLNAAAGLLFSAVFGIALALLGAVLAALVQFATARLLVGDVLARRLPARTRQRLDRLLEGHSLLTVIQLRLVPVIPFAAVNYGCGLTSMRTAPFTLGTVLGGVPMTAALVVLGDNAADPLSPAFLASAALALVLGAAAWMLRGVGRWVPAPREGSSD